MDAVVNSVKRWCFQGRAIELEAGGRRDGEA